jgi:hypothetical protein
MQAAVASAVDAVSAQRPDAPVVCNRAFNAIYERFKFCSTAEAALIARCEAFEPLARAGARAGAPRSIGDVLAACREHDRVTSLAAAHIFLFANRPWPRDAAQRDTSTSVMNALFCQRFLLTDPVLDLLANAVLAGAAAVAEIEPIISRLGAMPAVLPALGPRFKTTAWLLAEGGVCLRALEAEFEMHRRGQSALHAEALECRRQAVLSVSLDALIVSLTETLDRFEFSAELQTTACVLAVLRADEPVLRSIFDAFFTRHAAAKPLDVFACSQWLFAVCERHLAVLELGPTLTASTSAALARFDATTAAADAAKFVVAGLRAAAAAAQQQQWRSPKFAYIPAAATLVKALADQDIFVRAFWQRVSVELVRSFGSWAAGLDCLRDTVAAWLPSMTAITGAHSGLKQMMADTATVLQLLPPPTPSPQSGGGVGQALIATNMAWKFPPLDPIEIAHACFKPYRDFLAAIEKIYHATRSGRRLNWLHPLSTVHVVVGRATLTLSLVQYAVLHAVVAAGDAAGAFGGDAAKRLCIGTSVNAASITNTTGISDADVEKAVETLVAHRVVERTANGLQLCDNCKTRKPLNLALMQPLRTRSEPAKFVESERIFALQAAVVRALKSRRRVESEQALFALVAGGPSLPFAITDVIFKRVVAKLEEMEYLTKEPDGSIVYIS